VIWTTSITGSSGLFTRWSSISATIRFSKKKFDLPVGFSSATSYPRFQFLDVTGSAGMKRELGSTCMCG
jgi:hypothetical protein